MQNLINLNNIATMSSLEIAELTGKNHKDVMRDIRTMLEQAEIDERIFALSYLDAQNRSQPLYKLPRRECDLLITGYSVKYRLAIIDRWQELETKQAPSLSTTDLLRIGFEAAVERDRLQLVVQEQAPKVLAFNELEQSEGTMSITAAAKALGATPAKDLFQWLVNINWISRKRGEKDKEEWECKVYAIERCFMESIPRVVKHKSKPSFVVMQPVVTAKGLAHLAKTKGDLTRFYPVQVAA